MSDEPQNPNDDQEDEPGGVLDLTSVLYVVGGVPFMILFFVLVFGLVGACDAQNVMFPA